MQKTTSNDDVKYSDLKEMYDQTNNTIEEFLGILISIFKITTPYHNTNTDILKLLTGGVNTLGDYKDELLSIASWHFTKEEKTRYKKHLRDKVTNPFIVGENSFCVGNCNRNPEKIISTLLKYQTIMSNMPIVCTEIVTSIFREVKIILKEKVGKNPDDKNAKEVLGKLDSLYVNLTLETAKHTLNVQKENISVLKESEGK